MRIFKTILLHEWTGCVKEYEDVNHPPVVKLVTSANITVKSGKIFHLDATECYDPDGDGLIYYWFNYREAGTCKDEARLFPPNSAKIMAKAPIVDKPETVHFILKVTDRGTPRLSRYARGNCNRRTIKLIDYD